MIQFTNRLLLVVAWCGKLVVSASVLAWDNSASYNNYGEVESISGLLHARGGSDVRSLINAKRIIQDLSSSPSCAYIPTARMLRQCKLIKPNTQDSTSDQQKANVQATYGISMALCEAHQARVSMPQGCYVFEAMLERRMPEDSVEIVRTSDIEKCMNAIYQTSLWTSYTTFRVQSNDLCDSSRVDYQREELLETFRQATDVVPEVLEALREHNAESAASLSDLRDLSADLSEAQRNMIIASDQQTVKAKERLDQLTQYIEEHILLMGESGATWQANLKHGMDQASKELAVMTVKASTMQTSFSELYAQAVEAMSGAAHTFERSVATMTGDVNQVVNDLVGLNANEEFEKLRRTLILGQDVADQFASNQAAQYEAARQQLSLGQDLLSVIQDSHDHFHQIKETLELFPSSWFDLLHQIHGTAVRFKDEVKYSLTLILPSLLLLLLGRFRPAVVMALFYVFIRTFWSIRNDLQHHLTAIPINEEDLKTMFACTFGAACAGGSAAFIGSFFFVLFTRRGKNPGEIGTDRNSINLQSNANLGVTSSNDWRRPPSLHASNVPDVPLSSGFMTSSNPRTEWSSKKLGKQEKAEQFNDRFTRAHTVPLDCAYV